MIKKIANLFFYFLLIFQSISCTKNTHDNNEVLVIGNNANFPPYESVNDKGEKEGFDIDLANEIGKKLKKKIIIKELDFDSQILALKQGKIDLIISGMAVTKERQEEIYQIPYLDLPSPKIGILFWKSIPNDLNDFSDLKNKFSKDDVLTIQSGYFLEKKLRSETNLTVRTLAGQLEQIMDLKYQKSKMAIMMDEVAKYYAKTNPDLKLVEMTLPKSEEDHGNGIGIAKKNASLASDIREVIKTLNQDGTIQKLYNKWFKQKS